MVKLKLIREYSRFLFGARHTDTLLSSMSLNPTLPEGQQVFGINHVVYRIQEVCDTLTSSANSRNHHPKSEFPDTTTTSKQSFVKIALLGLLC